MGNSPTPSLDARARAAWALAFQGRHETNWGRLVDCRNRLTGYLRDPHPGVRRLALAFQPEPETGRAA